MSSSVITMLADSVARDFSAVYAPYGTGWRRLGADWARDVVTDEVFSDDVRAWLAGLEEEGGANVLARVREMLDGNDGWAQVIARRAMKQLRDQAAGHLTPAQLLAARHDTPDQSGALLDSESLAKAE